MAGYGGQLHGLIRAFGDLMITEATRKRKETKCQDDEEKRLVEVYFVGVDVDGALGGSNRFKRTNIERETIGLGFRLWFATEILKHHISKHCHRAIEQDVLTLGRQLYSSFDPGPNRLPPRISPNTVGGKPVRPTPQIPF